MSFKLSISRLLCDSSFTSSSASFHLVFKLSDRDLFFLRLNLVVYRRLVSTLDTIRQ